MIYPLYLLRNILRILTTYVDVCCITTYVAQHNIIMYIFLPLPEFTIGKETLALILSLEHFEIYVSNSDPLVVYTDHNPLLFLQRSAFSNRRLLRWSLALQELPLEIRHVKGKDNVVADCLSRVITV